MTMYKKYKQIGIPRAISYYNNYPFYYGFFTSLGLEVVLSDKTTTKTINEGTKYVVSDINFFKFNEKSVSNAKFSGILLHKRLYLRTQKTELR